jgi:hypothetical protein
MQGKEVVYDPHPFSGHDFVLVDFCLDPHPFSGHNVVLVDFCLLLACLPGA